MKMLEWLLPVRSVLKSAHAMDTPCPRAAAAAQITDILLRADC